MVIQNLDGQLISNEKDVFGIGLLGGLEESRVERINSGTVMVAKFNERVQYLFEVGSDLEVSKLKGVSLMYPLQGSRLLLSRLSDDVSERMIKNRTVLFRDCRLPTFSEYTRYLTAITV